MDRNERLQDLLRLTRYPLAPTAAADVVAAAVLAGGGALPPLSVVPAALASVCLYMGGMVQNDVCDRVRDRDLHPGRPLVRRPELVRTAIALMVVLFGLGLLLAWMAGAVWFGLGVAAAATAYNTFAKRRFPGDAVTLGAARGLNLGVGLAVGGASLDDRWLLLTVAYLLFIGAITGVSRAEDLSTAKLQRRALVGGFCVQLLALGGFASLLSRDRTLLWVPAAALLVLLLRSLIKTDRRSVMGYVLGSLFCIFLVHTVLAWGAGSAVGALVVAGLGAASVFLWRWARSANSAARQPPAST